MRLFLSQAITDTPMHTFSACWIVYHNAVISGLPEKTVGQLQSLQDTAAHVLTRTRKRAHITPVLTLHQSLYWLPDSFRIDFKIILLVNKARTCLLDLFLAYEL